MRQKEWFVKLWTKSIKFHCYVIISITKFFFFSTQSIEELKCLETLFQQCIISNHVNTVCVHSPPPFTMFRFSELTGFLMFLRAHPTLFHHLYVRLALVKRWVCQHKLFLIEFMSFSGARSTGFYLLI